MIHKPKELMNRFEDLCMVAHNAIHSRATNVLIEGQIVAIEKAPNSCRSLSYDGYRFMEQNKNKSSVWAKKAREGEKITWELNTWSRIDSIGVHVRKESVQIHYI